MTLKSCGTTSAKNAVAPNLRSRPAALCVGVSLFLASLFQPLLAQEPEFELPEVLDRAASYVVQYERDLATLAAHEWYVQQLRAADGNERSRLLRSEVLFVQLYPDKTWFAVRDVFEVDGRRVAERDDSLFELLSQGGTDVSTRGMAIAERSARYNLGPVIRTINLPTFALALLRPAHQPRVRFEKSAEQDVHGMRVWVVTFHEVHLPTLIATPGGADIKSQGRFWIDPVSGRVVQTELIVGGSRRRPNRARITVSFRPDPTLDLWVPSIMHESIMPETGGGQVQNDESVAISGTATYEDYRRVQGALWQLAHDGQAAQAMARRFARVTELRVEIDGELTSSTWLRAGEAPADLAQQYRRQLVAAGWSERDLLADQRAASAAVLVADEPASPEPFTAPIGDVATAGDPGTPHAPETDALAGQTPTSALAPPLATTSIQLSVAPSGWPPALPDFARPASPSSDVPGDQRPQERGEPAVDPSPTDAHGGGRQDNRHVEQEGKETEEEFVVEVAVVRARGETFAIVTHLALRGFPVYAVESQEEQFGTVFRVYVGRFTDRGEAVALARRIRDQEQFDARVVPLSLAR